MAPTCTRPFDEELLSGYLDQALPHHTAQRVRIHLEDCETCRTLYEQMSSLRQTALETQFILPEDDAWPELPKTRVSHVTRSLGWLLLTSWTLVITVYSLWLFLSQTGDPLEIFLVLGLPGAFVLLFLSVLADRLKDLKSDRYRGVHR